MKGSCSKFLCAYLAMRVCFVYTGIAAAGNYELDPLLKKAYLAYQDPNRPRSEIIPLFEEYAEKNPDSIFLPEVYYRIGALYSIHRKLELGEKKDLSLQRRYYQKAHSLYGEKYCFVHQVAWSSLTGGHDVSLEVRKAYFDWLLKLQKGAGGADIYPIRDIGQVLNGMAPERSPEETQAILEYLHRNIGLHIYSTARNIFWFEGGKYDSLVDLAASYPDTELGREAARKVHEADEYFLGFVDPSFADPNMDRGSVEPNTNLGPAPKREEIFLPRFEMASRQGRPAILDLATRKLIHWPNVGLHTEQMHRIAVKSKRGDLAWDGRLVAIRGGEILSTKQESMRPLASTKSAWTHSYELPKDLKLPYHVVVVVKGSTSYLMSVQSIEENGITISYTESAPQIVASPVQKGATTLDGP